MRWLSGNIFIRDNDSPHETGWKMMGDLHAFDHTTYIVAGEYRCRKWSPFVDETGKPNGQYSLVYDVLKAAGTWLLIEANCKHDFECVQGPGILHCIFSHRDPQTHEVVQEWNGWTPAAR